ncbi:MAG TPA: cytochrome bc complex cytochrome b subunit [Sedimenticola sp.]|nr:cytochrome bc complex cytochrome b subunit [Sedimenticola sp.]
METTAAEIKEKSFREKLIDVIQEEVPDHLNSFAYCLGATPLILFLILAVSGVLLTFYYIPFPGQAYGSVKAITEEIYLGWFIRGVHRAAVNLMVATLLLHIVRVFITRAYRDGGEMKWLLGAALFFTVLAFGFTGYSLVYDNVSYWGMTVVTDMIGQIPVVGKSLFLLLRGGEDITELTLLRLYDLHTKILPLVILVLIGAHIVAIRTIGFAKVDGNGGTHPFYPEHALKMTAIAIMLLIVIVNMAAIFPPVIGDPANPLEVASDVSPPWYFSAIYRWIIIAPREAGLFSVFAFFIVFTIYPYIDRGFADRGANMLRINLAIGILVAVFFALMTIWEALV